MSNNCSNQFRFRRALFIVPLIATALAGTQASAQQLISKGPHTDETLGLEGKWDAGPNHFFINSDEDVELIRFNNPHQMEMCAKGSHVKGSSAVRGYPISIKFNDQTATIAAGDCMHIDAARVTVRAASNLPQGVALEGTLKIKR